MDVAMHRISNIWSDMEREKGDLVERSQAYARWTLPHVLRPDNSEMHEQDKGSVDIGPKLVNHLANKVVDVLFPVSRPFFTIALTPEATLNLTKEAGETEMPKVKGEIAKATAHLEKSAMRELKLTSYRPVAVQAAKHLIIAGNVVLRRMPSGLRVTYGVDRFGVRRDIEGNEVEVVLYEKKRLDTFLSDQQVMITATNSYKPEDEVVLLTHYIKEGRRWKITQEAEGHAVGKPMYQNKDDYDLLCLTWDLATGYNYGTGLVENYAATFHKLDVTTEASTALMAVICDVKFFVRAGSAASQEIDHINNSPIGSYHVGNDGDISVPEYGKRSDLSTILTSIDAWERMLSQAFLLSSTRSAERVTAEEIRMQAQELASSFGGIYAKLALAWQEKEAQYALTMIDVKKEIGSEMFDMFDVLVTTGIESLSREGQVDNLRMAVQDLQMLEAVPEELRGEIHPKRFAAHVFRNHYVDFNDFMKTEEEKAADQAEMQAQIENQQNAETANAVAVKQAGQA